MSVASVKAIAEGRVWIGASALGLGLVDRLGNLGDAIADIAGEVGLDADSWVAYPDVTTDFIERLLEETSQLKARRGVMLDSEMLRYLLFAKQITEMSPVQARMPEIVIR